MGGAWKLSALLAAALCAALLAACGGGDGDSTATTATDQTTAEAPSNSGDAGDGTGGKGEGKGSKSGVKKGGSGSGGDSPGSSDSSGDSGNKSGNGSKGSPDSAGGGSVGGNVNFSGAPTKHKHPAPVDGQRADVFLVPGGDNSIQEYGKEQDEGQRVAAMVPIAALYKAQFGGDWTEVCSTYLSANNVKQLELLSEKSPQLKGKGCAEVLSGLTQAQGIRTPDTPDGGVVSFRVDGDTGFAIYWGIDGKGYAFALKSEGGAWKLTSLAPTPLQVG